MLLIDFVTTFLQQLSANRQPWYIDLSSSEIWDEEHYQPSFSSFDKFPPETAADDFQNGRWKPSLSNTRSTGRRYVKRSASLSILRDIFKYRNEINNNNNGDVSDYVSETNLDKSADTNFITDATDNSLHTIVGDILSGTSVGRSRRNAIARDRSRWTFPYYQCETQKWVTSLVVPELPSGSGYRIE